MSEQQPYRGNKYGTAGGNLGDGSASSTFGRSNAAAGRQGEQYFSRAVRKNARTSNYMMYQSMRMPRPRGAKSYNSNVDIDFVLASGNRVVLIDCKMWSSKHFYWSIAGTLFKDFQPSGKLSRNMEMALARTREMLPGCQVTAMVCFVPVKGGRMPKSVGLLLWPGRIRSFMANDGINRAARFLGQPSAPHADIQALMGKLTR